MAGPVARAAWHSLKAQLAERYLPKCITFNNGHGRIFNEFGKSKAARRSVAMTKRVHDILLKRWTDACKSKSGWVFPAMKAEAGHVVPNTIYDPHLAAIQQAKIRRFVLYSLRHTALTRLGESGCDIYTLARIAGWSNINMAKHYVHTSDDQTDVAIRRMEQSALAKDGRPEQPSPSTNLVQKRNLRLARLRHKSSITHSSTAS